MKPFLPSLRLWSLLFVTSLFIQGCDILSGLSQGVKPSAKVVNTSLQGFDLQGVELHFGVEIQNPYSTDIPLTQLAYGLSTEGQTFVSGKLTENPGSIPALGSKVVDVPVRVDFRSAMQLVNSIKPGSSLPYAADLTVSVDALGMGNIDIPLRHSGQVPIPTIPEVDVTSVDWKEVSMNKARAEIHVKMKNTNDFALQMQKLNYHFTLGGNKLASSQLQMTQSLNGGGETALIIPLDFAPMNMGMGLLNLIRGSDADYQLQGDLQVGTEFGPLDFPITKAGQVNFIR